MMFPVAKSWLAATALLSVIAPSVAVHDELKQIKHIVIFMQENRDYHKYFATMEGELGFL